MPVKRKRGFPAEDYPATPNGRKRADAYAKRIRAFGKGSSCAMRFNARVSEEYVPWRNGRRLRYVVYEILRKAPAKCRLRR